MKKTVENNVEKYIAECPKDIQIKLNQIRAAIKEVAPDSTERTDYFQMPGYSYEGYDYNGMFVWFSFKKPYVRLHVRPPVLQDNKKDLDGYKMTQAIISFPADKEIPIELIKKLVEESIKIMKKPSK